MIIDGSGTILTPGNNGQKCKGNGEHREENVMNAIAILNASRIGRKCCSKIQNEIKRITISDGSVKHTMFRKV